MKQAIIFFLLILGLSPAAVALESNIGLIKNSSGEASILRDQAQMPVETGSHLNKEDVIKTGSDGSVGIVFTDGTTVALGPGTEFSIQDYLYEPKTEAYAFSLYLKKGSAIYSSGKIGKLAPDAVKLNTPKATVGIRGTRVILEVN